MAERIAKPFGKAVVEYPAFEAALSTLNHFMQREQSKARSIVVAGPSGSGKSLLMKYFVHQHPVEESAEATCRPVLYIKTPPKTDLGSVLSRFLSALGDPHPESDNIEARIRRVNTQLSGQNVRMAIIDESQDLLPKSGADDKTPVVKLLKDLMEELKIPIVLTGTSDAVSIIDADTQIRTRVKRLHRLSYFTCLAHEYALDFAEYWDSLLTSFPRNVRGFTFTHDDKKGDVQLNTNITNLLRILLATNGCQRRIDDLLEEVELLSEEGDTVTKATFAKAWGYFAELVEPGREKSAHPKEGIVNHGLTFNPFEAEPQTIRDEATARGLYNVSNF